MTINPNIFHFATTELSQDAFLCWLISHIDSEDRDLRQCAKDFVAQLYNLRKSDAERITQNDIGSLVTLKQQYFHSDIYFQCKIRMQNVSFIIEDKTYTSAHSDQLTRYRKEIQKMLPEKEEIVCIYFKTGYLFAPERKHVEEQQYQIFDHKNMYDFLSKYEMNNVIFNSYREYIHDTFYVPYTTWFELFMNGTGVNHHGKIIEQPLSHDFVQWEFMDRLRERCTDYIQEEPVIYRGTNIGGSPWTQMRFVNRKGVYGEELGESVFYRLDRRGNRYYLSIRQYCISKGKGDGVEEKRNQRLQTYQQVFDSISKDGLEFDKPFHKKGSNEREIAVLFFDKPDNAPQKVLDKIGPMHAEFVKAIRDSDLMKT